MRSSSFFPAGSVIAGGIVVILAGACSSFTADGDGSNDAAADQGARTGDAGDRDSTSTADASPDASPNDALVLAKGFGMLSSIAANETDVYFGDQSSGHIYRVSIENGGAPLDLHALKNPTSLAVTPNGTLFWGESSGRKIGRIEMGLKAEVATRDALVPVSLALAAPLANASALRLVVGGRLTDAPTSDVQHYDATTLSMVQAAPAMLTNVFDVAARANVLYWTDSSAAKIYTSSIESMIAAPLFEGETDCQSIAADAEGVYWTRPQMNVVRWAPATGTGSVKDLASNQQTPRSLAADDSGVYWMTADGFIRRARRNETPPQDLAQGFKSAFGNEYLQTLALTSKYVVWITTDGMVLRAPK